MISWLVVAALAAEPEVDDLREEVASGVVVNWTRLTVEATTSARGAGLASSRKAVELEARRQLPASVEAGAVRVRVHPERTVADLVADEALAVPMRARIDRWVVVEARYFTSGRVELVGELSLVDLLKPWTMRRAEAPPLDAPEPAFTGVIVDARGSGAEPAFAPVIAAPDGTPLYSGSLWADAAVDHGPVVYVPDPAHPAAVRAGSNPLVVRVDHADGATLLLATEGAIRFRSGVMGAKVLGEGTVVVVLDP